MLRGKFFMLSLTLVAVLLVGLLPLPINTTASAVNGSLQNLGFEQDFTGWIVGPVADAAVVVGSENATDFDAYADMNVSVDPYRGSYMARLGNPKTLNEKQERGENTIKQDFTPDCDNIIISFRLFSFEHRGNDLFMFNVQDSSGNSINLPVRKPGTENEPVTITIGDSSIAIDQLPFVTSIDVGDRKDFLDTGWVEAEIYGITPDSETELTLVYSVEGTDNEAHATWAYFDNVNRPPVADFIYSPEDPWEGDIIEFIDQSYDPDEPEDYIVSWEWRIEIEGDSIYSDLRNPFFIPADDGVFSVTLTVTDSYGATDELTIPLVVDNAPPKVNALNIEVLAGEDANLFGRFIDPGWTDTPHTATWQVDGSSPDAPVDEDNLAFMGTGIVTGTMPAPGMEVPGTLTVQDNSGDSGSDDFVISVIEDNINRHEDNDTIDNAYPLEDDAAYLSYLQSIDDVDVFEAVSADESPLPAGSEVLVTLKDLPADYDLMVLTEQPDTLEPGGFQVGGFQVGAFQVGGFQVGAFQVGGFQVGGFQVGGFQVGGFQVGAFQVGAFQVGGFQVGGFHRAAFQVGGFQVGAFQVGGFQVGAFQVGAFQVGTFDQYPLSQIGFTGIQATEDDSIGGMDISPAELGLSLADLGISSTDGQNIKVAGFSANRGLKDETLLARVNTTGTRVFIVIVGANDAHSDLPYTLQIEKSVPPDIAEWLSENGITYERPVSDWTDDPNGPIVYDYPGEPKTLIVTQKERIIGRYGQSEWEALEAALTDPGDINLANNPAIAADIMSANISLYANWDNNYATANTSDTNYHSIDAANEVASKIRNMISKHLLQNESIEYVVILGNDDIVPFYRVPDETGIGNESEYAMNSYLKPGSPLFYSVAGGWIITDDYYVDENAIPWQGRALYIPDLAIARLVENPSEMIEAAEAFVSNGGNINPGTALVTGYDFFDNGAQAVAATLTGAGITTNTTLISDFWTAEDLASAFLETGYDINNVNAHCTHYTALSADGFNTDNSSDVLTSTQVSYASAALLKTLTFMMGCHAGLNIPDEAAPDSTLLGLDMNPQLDFAQALHQAVCLASTGFAYGDDEGIGGTEHLIGIFADQLMNGTGDTTVGKALLAAKQRYYNITSPWTVYDEKSSIQFELYGLPQYTLQAEEGFYGFVMLNDEPITTYSSLTLNVEDGATVYSRNPDLQLLGTGAGYYYAADGDSQATAFRPVQPRVVIDDLPAIELPLNGNPLYPAHGVLLMGGQFTYEENFDPMISRPTIEWELYATESQLLPPSLWPSELAYIKSLETGSQLVQTLGVIPGQFRPTGEKANGDVIGIQRLYNNLSFEITRPETLTLSADYTPPVVSGVGLQEVEGGVNVSIDATDESGIDRIVVLIIQKDAVNLTGTINSYTFENPGEPMIVPTFGEDDEIVIQVVDGAGNVVTVTGKGANMSTIAIYAGPDLIYAPGHPVTLKATIPDFINLSEELSAPVSFVWEFGDGSTYSGLLSPADKQTVDVTIDSYGNATFSVQHTYSDSAPIEMTATLKVTDSNGGIGVDDVTLTRWYDPEGDAPIPEADLIGGYAFNEGNIMNIALKVADPETLFDNFQYRIKITAESGGVSHLKYNAGLATGLSSLQVTINGDEILFTFDLGEIGATSGEYLQITTEIQGGVASEGSVGIADKMPDSGYFNYVIY